MEVKTYKIEVKEFLSRLVEIEAENIDEAISKVKEMYQKGEIVLDYNNYVTREIEKYKE